MLPAASAAEDANDFMPLGSNITPASAIPQALVAEPQLEQHPILNPDAHIALLLPLEDKNFSTAAQGVRDGFMAAAMLNPDGLPVRVYSKFDENLDVLKAYRQAVANGAQLVVGPLTRNGVSLLAAEKNIPVPTLALNLVDADPAANLYFFGMASEAEARTVAELAAQQQVHKAVVIATASLLSQRMAFAFEEAWNKLGLRIVREIDFKDSSAALANLGNVPDTMVFIATDAQSARQIRPYLPNKFPVYATSQIFKGNDDTLTNYDLNGIRFVDMPWLLQPDHPSVMAYAHAPAVWSADQERLYALGVDAYRLAQRLLAHEVSGDFVLNGVTGQIRLREQMFLRTAMPGIFSQGHALSTERVAPVIQMFPDQFKTQP